MTQELADSIRRLREILRERYKMTNLTTQDVAHVEFQSAVYYPKAIQAINQLVELVEEMQTAIKCWNNAQRAFPSERANAMRGAVRKGNKATTKADALLSGLKEEK